MAAGDASPGLTLILILAEFAEGLQYRVDLRREIASYLALANCIREVSRAMHRSTTANAAAMATSVQVFLAAFVVAYGEEYMLPKHDYMHHMPKLTPK